MNSFIGCSVYMPLCLFNLRTGENSFLLQKNESLAEQPLTVLALTFL